MSTSVLKMPILSRLLLPVLLALALVIGSLAGSAAQADEHGPVFELRVYTSTPGNLDALLTRFRNHTAGLFEKHGMTNLGYWVPTDGEQAENTIIYSAQA